MEELKNSMRNVVSAIDTYMDEQKRINELIADRMTIKQLLEKYPDRAEFYFALNEPTIAIPREFLENEIFVDLTIYDKYSFILEGLGYEKPDRDPQLVLCALGELLRIDLIGKIQENLKIDNYGSLFMELSSVYEKHGELLNKFSEFIMNSGVDF